MPEHGTTPRARCATTASQGRRTRCPRPAPTPSIRSPATGCREPDATWSNEAGMSGLIGFVGLGQMGGPMSRRLLAAGHRLVVHDVRAAVRDALVVEGAQTAGSPGGGGAPG